MWRVEALRSRSRWRLPACDRPRAGQRRDVPAEPQLGSAAQVPVGDGLGAGTPGETGGEEESLGRVEIARGVEPVVELAELVELLVTS